jgi:predicted DNA-binding transcriptional regulator YafY
MSWQISQHNNNKLLLLSIADYFKSSNKVYYHDINSLKSLWVALNYEKILFWIILENILYMVLKLLD